MKSIYGDCFTCGDDVSAITDCTISEFMMVTQNSYIALLETLRVTLDKLLKYTLSGEGVTLFQAEMGGKVHYDFYIKVRMAWRAMNPGVKFCIDNELHTNLLKDLYLANGEDWRTDNVLNPSAEDDCGCPTKK